MEVVFQHEVFQFNYHKANFLEDLGNMQKYLL